LRLSSTSIDAARIPECLVGGYADSMLSPKEYLRMAQRDFAPEGCARRSRQRQVYVASGKPGASMRVMQAGFLMFCAAIHSSACR
jgi:hypothetical protein